LETAFPALVRTVAEATSLDEITRLLRALASEKVSIRDLRFILETVLDFPFRAPDASRYLILDDRLSADRLGAWLGGVDLLSFVRSGMKRQISHDFARGASTLVVYLLSTELELSIPFAKDKDKIDAVLDSIRAQVIDVNTMTTYILTSQKIRRDLYNITHLELPLVAVISNQDLIPDVNLWPVGTIQLQA
jgi:type III secretory pathway component EscV